MGKKKAWYAVRSALRHRTLTSAISPVRCGLPATTEAVYSLDGRRVSTESLQPGLYIKDGKKVVIK
jgi:hypothetical protein